MATTVLALAEIETLALNALAAAGASSEAAVAVARAIAAAERDGIASHGLAYLPTYCQHLLCGKVNAAARPRAETSAAVVRVDADDGFAHPAIEQGFALLEPLARSHGVATLAVRNSYNCGVLGYHTEALAVRGLVALGFTNAPASIAPWRARKAVLGTNPWSLAVPGAEGNAALVIDQSASVVAKSEILKHQREGRQIPEGWALDAEGQPTTSPDEALRGTMVPAGGYKGVGSALLVEIFAACLSGATPGIEAAPFSGTAGGPPRTGQFFIAVDPAATANGLFASRLSTVLRAFEAADGARVPGARRMSARRISMERGVAVDRALVAKARELANVPSP